MRGILVQYSHDSHRGFPEMQENIAAFTLALLIRRHQKNHLLIATASSINFSIGRVINNDCLAIRASKKNGLQQQTVVGAMFEYSGHQRAA